MIMRKYLLVLGLTVFFLPSGAAADQGDWSAGVSGALGFPSDEAIPYRIELRSRLGLSDWVGLEAAAGIRHLDALGFQGELGLVASADIFQWVPDLVVSALADFGPEDDATWAHAFGLRMQVRGRYFLSMKSALSVATGMTWLHSDSAPFVSVGWSRLLN